jgi:flagellin
MRINHNINALNAWRNLGSANNGMGKSLEKLSSGFRINRAGDDAAGLAISEKMRGQIRGLSQASRNAQDGISLIQTAEGALTETHSMLQRMRELAVQSANDTNTDADRQALQDEVKQLQKEVNRIAETTQFNKKNLLNGDMGVDTSGSDLTTNIIDNTYLVDAAGSSVDSGTITLSAADANGTISIISGGDVASADGIVSIELSDFEGNVAFSGTNSGWYLDSDVKVDIENFGTITLTAGTLISSGSATGFDASTLTVSAAFNGKEVDFVNNESTLKIGANAGEDENMTVLIGNMDSTTLGIDNVNIATQSGAESAITTIDSAIKDVSTQRSKLGATQNRLEHTINNLSVSSENLTAAESRIRDVDMAREMMSFTKQQILMQTSNSMLAQANQIPQNVLSLLR